MASKKSSSTKRAGNKPATRKGSLNKVADNKQKSKGRVSPSKSASQNELEAGSVHAPLCNVIPGSRGARRRHLDERLRSLYQRAMQLETELRRLEDNRFYRVCIFGSARIKPENETYAHVFTMARYLAWEGIDILTGGGPGLMEAANKGAQLGTQEKQTKSLSFGLSIELDFEPSPNLHLDVKRHHHKFSSRLDDFMRLSHSIICTPGGIGTLLELYFSWQLVQVKHISMRPVVLLDKSYWDGVIDWMKEVPTKRGLISPKDFDCIKIVDTPEEAVEVISEHHKTFRIEQAEKRLS